MTRARDPADPQGAIAEAYRIAGIDEAACRAILFDWALAVPAEADMRMLIRSLLDRHGGAADHPMTRVLQEGLTDATTPGRRGGWRGRRGRGRG